MADVLAGAELDDTLVSDAGGSAANTVPYGHDTRAAAVRRVAAIMLEHLDGLAVRSASEIWIRETEFRGWVERPEQLYGPCRITMGSALRSLVGVGPDDIRAKDVYDLGRTAAEQSVPLEVVLRGLRVDFLVLWSEMLLVARTTDPTTQQSLINASEIVWGAVDAVTVQFTIGYRSNRDARERAEALRREELVQRVLHGESVPADDVAAALGIEQHDDLVVAVVGHVPGIELDDLARCIRYAAMHSVWVDRGGTAAGLIALRGVKPETLAGALRGVRGARIGLARPRRGLADITSAAREASVALATLLPGQQGVVTVYDDPLGVLVAAQPELAADLLQRLFAPLLVRPARERDMLLDTLVAFDDCDGSVPAVAARLFCHRNTVLNRLGKINKMTGLSFTSPTGLALVALAARGIRSGLVGRPYVR